MGVPHLSVPGSKGNAWEIKDHDNTHPYTQTHTHTSTPEIDL